MRTPSLSLALAAGLLISAATPVAAQTPAGASAQAPQPGNVLTLADAITLARRNNPAYQTAANARRNASAAVRAANGALLPQVNTSFGAGYREGRPTFFQGQAFGSPNDQLSTDVGASASLNLSRATFAERKAARANQEATEAEIVTAEQRVRNDVTTQYLTALQAQARAVLQDTLLATTTAQLALARARFQVGSGTQLDVQRAEVADGQQRVASLNARNTARIEVLRLFQQIGIPSVDGVTLDANLPAAPTVDVAAVLAQAQRTNPAIEAFRAREVAAARGISSAKSSYFPSLQLSANVSGFTNRYTDTDLLISQQRATTAGQQASCLTTEEIRSRVGLSPLRDCSAIVFSPSDEAAIRSQQSKYPYDFTRNPYNLSAQFSLPIFNGFRREQQVEQASVQRRNAQNDLRAQELRVETEVKAAALSLATAQETVGLQEQNVRTARTALALAQERYRVGAISLVELVQARGDFERAETDRITAVYDVQRAFAALEAAVGRPLR